MNETMKQVEWLETEASFLDRFALDEGVDTKEAREQARRLRRQAEDFRANLDTVRNWKPVVAEDRRTFRPITVATGPEPLPFKRGRGR